MGELGSKTSAWKKRKDVSRKKRTVSLVKDDEELVKKGRKKRF